VVSVLKRALGDVERGSGPALHRGRPVLLDLAKLCDGDLRRALNALEVLVLSLPERARSLPRSWRPSPANGASVTMPTKTSTTTPSPRSSRLAAVAIPMRRCTGLPRCCGRRGPRFIAAAWYPRLRGHRAADSHALSWPWRHISRDFIGLPEAELTLAHATLYIAPHRRALGTEALGAAKAALAISRPIVRFKLRDKRPGVKTDGHGQGYLYSHEFPEAIPARILESARALFAEIDWR